MIRLAVAAGVLAAGLSAADARPVWRSVPTPLPPVIHTAKVRPPYLGPVWRIAPVIPVTDVVEYVPPAVEVAPAPVADAAPVVEAPRPSAPAPAVVVAVANIAPAVEAAQPPPAPAPVATAVPPPPPKPAPVVVAEKAPVAPAKPAAAPPVAVAAPAVVETVPGIPWLDYLGVIALAAIVGGTIFFVARERRRPASRGAS